MYLSACPVLACVWAVTACIMLVSFLVACRFLWAMWEWRDDESRWLSPKMLIVIVISTFFDFFYCAANAVVGFDAFPQETSLVVLRIGDAIEGIGLMFGHYPAVLLAVYAAVEGSLTVASFVKSQAMNKPVLQNIALFFKICCGLIAFFTRLLPDVACTLGQAKGWMQIADVVRATFWLMIAAVCVWSLCFAWCNFTAFLQSQQEQQPQPQQGHSTAPPALQQLKGFLWMELLCVIGLLGVSASHLLGAFPLDFQTVCIAVTDFVDTDSCPSRIWKVLAAFVVEMLFPIALAYIWDANQPLLRSCFCCSPKQQDAEGNNGGAAREGEGGSLEQGFSSAASSLLPSINTLNSNSMIDNPASPPPAASRMFVHSQSHSRSDRDAMFAARSPSASARGDRDHEHATFSPQVSMSST